MLPATGFFKYMDCPFFEVSCDRPYCHFKHRKKTQQKSTEKSAPQAAEVPTYKPTPKSQLANVRNHIPITYVPDLAIRTSERNHSFRSSVASYRYDNNNKPTYNPTPLSMLPTPKTAVTKLIEDKIEIPKYSPTLYQEDSSDINFDNLETEFNMIDELMSDSGTLDTTIEEAESTDCERDTKTKQNGTIIKEESKSKSKSKSRTDAHTDKKGKSSEKKSTSKRSDHKKSSKDDKDKKKEKDAHHHKDKHSSSKHSSSRTNKHKHKSKTKERDKTKSTNDKHKEENRRNSEDKKSKEKEHKKDNNKKDIVSLNHKKETTNSLNDDDFEDCDIYDGLQHVSGEDESEIDEDDPIQECYKIFTEYKPTEPSIFLEVPKQNIKNTNSQEETFACNNTKKRIAHDNADKNRNVPATNKLKTAPNPAQAMVNRLKAARLAQINNSDEHKHITAEIDRMKRLAPETSSTVPPKVPKLSTKQTAKPSTSVSLVDDIISGKSTNTKPRRIAPVQNVGSIQRAKAKIDEIAKMRAVNAILKTASHTHSKGVKRVAHVPEFSVADLPDVLEIERSKLPVNVRSRYLKMIADECLKLYLSKDDGYQRALNEEFKCYERCSVLVTYRNTAMLAINRIRKELQERELSGLGPIFPGESPNADKGGECELKGRKFYENIKRLILSEDEMVLHGFPREGTTPGHALIKLQKKVTKTNLQKNDRICSRCAKHYKVDNDGFALYDEECLYHPLKKRTFRGESIYLCCKSGEGTGCVTSSTHVCDRINVSDDEVEGFQTTMSPETDDDPRSYEVFALDCEMCYTTKGLELTRVTIVNSECKTVYETLVKPLNPIIDYNTRFSGITADQMERTATSILQVQANILHLCNSNTILIGHSLESDMKALKIIHSSIIDTSVLFPHKFGLPHKRALRDLAREYLKKIIQNDVSGHDSAEDALTCMELVQWKLKEEFKARGIKV